MSAKPKALFYRDALAAVEQRIVDALPESVDGHIARAREGDTKAATYWLDRVMGRAAGPTDRQSHGRSGAGSSGGLG